MIGKPSPILTESDRWLFPLVMIVSVYLTFRGHNAPGGGFIGGLVAGAAFIIRYLAGVELTLGPRRTLQPHLLIGAGLFISAVTALVPLLVGDALLESVIWKGDLIVFGSVKVVSSSIFDIGVYLLVIGVVLLALVSLGADPVEASNSAEVSLREEQI